MKEITLALVLLSSLTLSQDTEAALPKLYKAVPFLVEPNPTNLKPRFEIQDEIINGPSSPENTPEGLTLPEATASSEDCGCSDDASLPIEPVDYAQSTETPIPQETISQDCSYGDAPAQTNISSDCSEMKCDNKDSRITYTFSVNDESFTALFPSSPELRPVACDGFSLFFSPGDVFTVLVAAPRESGDEDIAHLLSKWQKVLEQRYPDSSIAQVSRTTSLHANGQVSLDSVFFIADLGKFVRAQVILSEKNCYVLSTTFDPANAEESNAFFEGFSIVK